MREVHAGGGRRNRIGLVVLLLNVRAVSSAAGLTVEGLCGLGGARERGVEAVPWRCWTKGQQPASTARGHHRHYWRNQKNCCVPVMGFVIVFCPLTMAGAENWWSRRVT
jgi:hypothetical protein